MKSHKSSVRRYGGCTSSLLLALLGLSSMHTSVAHTAVSCSSLASLSLPNTTITLVQDVTPPATIGGVPVTLPFCRVTATLAPTADSNIRVELWLPPSDTWNNKYLGTGNGGYAGGFQYGALNDGLRRGYATANTDMGTSPSISLNADVLVGHPAKWEDFGYRATHLMTVRAKEIIDAYYNKGAKRSYFSGCSTGGQQGLMEAQRYPHDYDGILVGAPANHRTRLHNVTVWNFAATHPTPTSPVPLISNAKLALVQSAVIAACGTNNGGVATDLFLRDPRNCNFDPGALQCTGDDAPNCLTADQVNAMRAYYAGPKNPVTGEQIYAGAIRGGEAYPYGLSLQQVLPEPAFGSLFKWVFGSSWDWHTYDFNNNVATVDATLGGTLNAINPDLKAFRRGGSRMIIYQGFADPLLPPTATIDFYKKIAAHQGSLTATKNFVRLYMAPGVGHCFGGLGPNAFGAFAHPLTPQSDASNDMLKALEQWVEKDKIPERIVATKYVGDNPANGVAMQRPLCPYPQLARYVGTGDTNNADNFVCVNEQQ